MGIIKDWRPLNEVPDATYYTTIGDDRFTTVHWDLKEALSAVSDAFADVAHGDDDVCDIELGILVPIARGEDGPEGPTLAHEATSLTTTAHARIVELETEQGELHRELARLRGQLATAREDASEMEKKAIAEGSEALALRAEVAALKAAARYDAWLLSGDTGMSSKAIFHFMRTGAKGGWTPVDPADLGRCLRLLERFPEWRERMPEMANCSPRWAAMVPHWGLLEATLLREVGSLRASGNAPKTYDMMQAIERGDNPTPEASK